MNFFNLFRSSRNTSSRRPATRPLARSKARLDVENLDRRDLPSVSSIVLTPTVFPVLSIKCDNTPTNVHVERVGTSIQVQDGANNVLFSAPASKVVNISFTGGSAADTFANNAGVMCTASGMGGNDYLSGGSTTDHLYGGDADDILIGNGGNDYLYGENGNDILYGMAGDDYLNGAAGDDTFYGGSDYDRYFDAFGATDWAKNGYQTTDVFQGSAGTCSIDAAMAASVGKIDMSTKITYLGNYSYSVRMWNESRQADYRTITFDGNWDDNDCKPSVVRDATGNDTGRIQGEFWTVLFQRAYLQQQGVDYTNPDTATWGSDWMYETKALSSYLGWAVNWHGVSATEPTATAQTMANDLAAGKVLAARDENSGGGGHFYGIRNVYNSGGVWMVTLVNPWGKDGTNNSTTTYTNDGVNDGLITVNWWVFRTHFTHWYDAAR